jgi:hypothetical protein
MTEVSAPGATDRRDQIDFRINNQPYVAPERLITGRTISELAGLPLTNQVFLEVPGPEDRPIRADELVELHPGMKFYDVPVGTFG